MVKEDSLGALLLLIPRIGGSIPVVNDTAAYIIIKNFNSTVVHLFQN